MGSVRRWFVGDSLHVEVAVHAPRLAHVEALEASTPQQAPPPSPLSTRKSWPPDSGMSLEWSSRRVRAD
jgi:hypothetical protein